MTTTLEARATETKIAVQVNVGECKYCLWRIELKRRVAEDPNYVPHGGWEQKKKCIENKNYKNCSGFMPNNNKEIYIK